MSQSLGSCGVYVDDRHPKTKKALKEAVKNKPASVQIENLSLMSDEWRGGSLEQMPVNTVAYVAGPNPYRDRRWYANITKTSDGTIKVR